MATFTSLAFVTDPLMLLTCWWATEGWAPQDRYMVLAAEIIFMFCFTKVVKLVGLFRKNPSDIIYLPVSILFGYFHGLIKLYALFTLKEVRRPCYSVPPPLPPSLPPKHAQLKWTVTNMVL